MAYSVLADVTKYIEEAELIQLATKTAGKTTADAEVTGPVGEAIESADAEIDSYLLPRWPSLRSLSTVPPMVNKCSAILALNFLYVRRRLMPEAFIEEVKAVRRWLVDINTGKLTLAEDSAGAVATETQDTWLTDAETADDDDLPSNDQRNFTPDKLSKLTGV